MKCGVFPPILFSGGDYKCSASTSLNVWFKFSDETASVWIFFSETFKLQIQFNSVRAIQIISC